MTLLERFELHCSYCIHVTFHTPCARSGRGVGQGCVWKTPPHLSTLSWEGGGNKKGVRKGWTCLAFCTLNAFAQYSSVRPGKVRRLLLLKEEGISA